MWRARAFGRLLDRSAVTVLGGAQEVNGLFSIAGTEHGLSIEARYRLRSKHTVVCGCSRCRASAALQSDIRLVKGRQLASLHFLGEGLARFTAEQ